MKAQKELIDSIESYRNGDNEAFGQLYILSHKYLYVCIRHIIKDEELARDMLQETYLEITRSLSQLKNPENFLNWAAVIAKRKCYAHLSKEDKFVLSGQEDEGEEQDILEDVADDEAFIPESVIQDQEKRKLMREIIDSLSDMQRLCIIGYYYNEQTQEEIAQELGIPLNTVKSHLSRAKAKIKEEVLKLEREQDTKLYSLIPFTLMFFAKEAQACEPVPMGNELSHFVEEAGAGKVAGSSKWRLKTGKLAQLSMKTKMILGALVFIGIASAAAALWSFGGYKEGSTGQEAMRDREEAALEEKLAESTTEDSEETAEDIPLTAESRPENALYGEESGTEEMEGHQELAISGIYEELKDGRDGIIVAGSGGKWGLVTYDNDILVPIQYDFACPGPNDDGQTFFGNDGDYYVFDREGNEIFQTDKPIKAVSEGVVLWVQTTDEWDYNYGYVKLDGTVLYESIGGEIDGQAGAVGFNEGWAFSSNEEFTENRIAPDGTVTDIFEERTVLRHPELAEEPVISTTTMSSADSSEGSLFYPIGACYQGYYVSRGIDLFEDVNGKFYIYDAAGTQQYLLCMESVADYAGFSWWEDESLRWNLQGFYHNGNYCYSSGTLAAVSMTGGGETKSYLIDTAKLKSAGDGSGLTIVTNSSILLECEYIGIDDTAYWLVQQDGKWGYADHAGNIAAMFDDAALFCNGKAMVIEDGYAYFIDENMNLEEWNIPAQSVVALGEVYLVTTSEGEKCFTAER